MNDIDIWRQIAERDPDRLKGYKELLDFYQGKQWPGREKWGEKRLTLNYARVIIDKLTSYLMSGINFTVEPLEDTLEARGRAQKAEKSLERVYEYNHLAQLDFETETDCAVLGDACYKVTWESEAVSAEYSSLKGEKRGRVRVTAPDIQGIFVWWLGDDVSRIWRVASRYTLSTEEAEILFGKSPITNRRLLTGSSNRFTVNTPSLPAQANSRLRTLAEVWTDNSFELYLDGVLVEKKANPYGFIPFVIFPNLREPKKFWGASDITPLIEPQRELNRAFSQVSHILELSGNPVAVLENVEESTDIAVRPGAVWNLPEDAKAYLLDLLQGGGLQLHINYIDQLYRALYDLAESPKASFGGSNLNLSGTAMQIELYPLIQKVLRKRAIRTGVYKKRNMMILKMLEKFGGEKIDDLQCRIVWGQVLPSDKTQMITAESSLVSSGIHSRRRAMDEMGVKDPEAEFARWMEEQEKILQMNANTTK